MPRCPRRARSSFIWVGLSHPQALAGIAKWIGTVSNLAP
jgi:hypothetical protein